MKRERIETILNELVTTGADFAEVFLESNSTKVFNYIDKKLDALTINESNGLGLRIALDNQEYYGATNDFSSKGIKDVISNLTKNIDSEVKYKNIKLNRLKKYINDTNTHYTDADIKAKLASIDAKIWPKDKRISQVNIRFASTLQDVTIANQTGLYKYENRIRSRIFIIINFKDGERLANIYYSKGLSSSADILDSINYDEVIDELVKEGLDKLYAKPCPGGVMPVVIGPGFGGVIFHEACGHAMEATSVADGMSVLAHDLNKKVASEIVNIVDDGTLDREWGSTKIDDEGCETKRNILIKDGVLVGYLVDEINTKKMNMSVTGSGRRESYLFAPTSRMNNTYLLPGNDSFEDMIKSIKLGLYAKRLGGGQVSPETGEFNFGCDLAYMIRDGKIAECVKSASLIGTTKEILQNVEMISNDLALGPGMCGSASGSVPVNVGEPTIKVSSILVGGEQSAQ